MSESIPLPSVLRDFITATTWTYAKTMPVWPHEYLVRGRVDDALFLQLVSHIRVNGYAGTFYRKPITYFDEGGMVYWTMGETIAETTIINRCKKEDSYAYRLQHGTSAGEERHTPMKSVPRSSITFSSRETLKDFEGGFVDTAEAGGKFYLILDESALDDDDLKGTELVKCLEFDSISERADYINGRGWGKRPASGAE